LSDHQLLQQHSLDDSGSDNLDQLWQRALKELRSVLSKTDYETWVHGSELLDYSNGIFVIGVVNSHARDWLEDNIGVSINRVLHYLVGSPIDVRFVVTSEYEDEHTDGLAENERSSKFSQSYYDSPGKEGDGKDRLEVRLRFRRYWDELVDPERVISIPRYFIEYWLPLLGPNFSSAVIAFRQLRYLKNASAEIPFEARVDEILRWLPVGRTTFFRWMKNHPDIFEWFVKKDNAGKSTFTQVDDGRISQAPQKYIVYGGTPLTPSHQDLVTELLEQYGAGKDPEGTEAALNQLLQLDRHELYRLMQNRKINKSFVNCRPMSVWEIARSYLKEDISDKKAENLAKLCEDFENLLVRPDKTHLVTWYLLRDWQSHLGCSAFWLICILRSRCFYNLETGERRDEIWINGGYNELAKHLSVASETVSTWFGNNRKTRKGGTGKYLPLFIKEMERTRGFDEQNPRAVSVRFNVSMVDPLTEDGQTLFSEMVKRDGLSAQDLEELSKEWLVSNSPAFRDSGIGDTPAFQDSSGHDTPSYRDSDEYDTPAFRDLESGDSPAFRDSDNDDSPAFWDPESVDTPAFQDTLKDSLRNDLIPDSNYKPTMTIEHENTTTTKQAPDLNQLVLPIILTTSPSVEGKDSVVVVTQNWDLDQLLQNSNIPANMRKTIRKKRINPNHFVGWLLYAFSEKGRGIKNPGFYAVTQLLSDDPVIASEDFVKLANKGSAFVRENLEVLWNPNEWECDPLWKETMGSIERSSLKQLGKVLGI